MVIAMCAVVHLKEYIDTGEALDLVTADSLIGWPEMREWIEANQIMLPVRRDGKKLNE